MTVQRAYKVELEPNSTQLQLLLRACGAARWAYNWGLSKKAAAFRQKEKLIGAQKLDGELRKCAERTARVGMSELRHAPSARMERRAKPAGGGIKAASAVRGVASDVNSARRGRL